MKLRVLVDKLIWLNTLVLFVFFYLLETSAYAHFILLGIMGIFVGLVLIRDNFHLHCYWHAFNNYMLIFTTFCLFSYIWSIDKTATLIRTGTLFQLLVCMSLLYMYYIRQKSITPLINIIMWGGYILTLYSFAVYGIGTIRDVMANAGRLENSFANVNSIGMLAAFSILITVYKILFEKARWYYSLVIANAIMIAACGSRKALVLLILGTGLILFLRYSSKNWVISFIRYIVVGTVLLFLFHFLLEFPMFQGVNKRMESLFNSFNGSGYVDNSAFLRHWMLHVGWQQFLQTPFLGTGIASSGTLLLHAISWRTYFHNNYIELLATGGICGTFLYYLMLFVPACKLFRKQYLGNHETQLCLILIVLVLIMDWGAVSYYSKETYFYIMIFFIQVHINKRYVKQKER